MDITLCADRPTTDTSDDLAVFKAEIQALEGKGTEEAPEGGECVSSAWHATSK